MTDHTYSSEEQQAYDLGREHALAAASWVIDGNSSHAYIVTTLRRLVDGDPLTDYYLPRRPDLSGEYANDPTPLSLARDITGFDTAHIDDSIIDAIADAYEAGVSDTFEAECERILRAARHA